MLVECGVKSCIFNDGKWCRCDNILIIDKRCMFFEKERSVEEVMDNGRA
jgi:hypothetical protein